MGDMMHRAFGSWTAAFGTLALVAGIAACSGVDGDGSQQATFGDESAVREADVQPYYTDGDDAPSEVQDNATRQEPGRQEEGAKASRYPVLLYHGFSGWKQIEVLNLEYFYKVHQTLADDGESSVFEPQVAPYQSNAHRAQQLATQVDAVLRTTSASKVNIVAHSQGGLDARYLISTLGYGDRVASLTTISTPHRGTVLADIILGRVPSAVDQVANALANLLGRVLGDFDGDANLRAVLADLSEARSAEFNAQNVNDPRVAYYSFAGRSSGASGETECAGSWYPNIPSYVDSINPIMEVTSSWLSRLGEARGANDGMITVRSSRWGIFLGCVAADHWDEVGQLKKTAEDPGSGFDHKRFYLNLVRFLRSKGF